MIIGGLIFPFEMMPTSSGPGAGRHLVPLREFASISGADGSRAGSPSPLELVDTWTPGAGGGGGARWGERSPER